MASGAAVMTEAERLLGQYFGHTEFRPGQREIVQSMLAGEDLLALLPTGGGKSLCYQLPALLMPGLTLVVSPLIALMRNQVAALRARGIEAATLHSQMREEEEAAALAKLQDGVLKLLYLSPERLAQPAFLARLRKIELARIAVDEAHCAIEWGHDFRPDYQQIGDIAAALGRPAIAAFTATAGPALRDAICQTLLYPKPKIFTMSAARPNIKLQAAWKDRPRTQLLEFLNKHRGGSGIVYCARRQKTELLARALTEAGYEARAYHAGLNAAAREEIEGWFLAPKARLICATIAFGMGVDKPDIRFVAHADLSSGIEAYYQEVGRAGRDGAPAETLALYDWADFETRLIQLVERDYTPQIFAERFAALTRLLEVMSGTTCRARTVMAAFGEQLDDCGQCDNCRGAQRVDISNQAQEALGLMRGAAQPAAEWMQRLAKADLPPDLLLTRLVAKGWVGADAQLQDGSLRVGQEGQMVAEKAVLTVSAQALAAGSASGKGEKPAPLDTDYQRRLLALKRWRQAEARAQRIASFMVLPDKILTALAAANPTDKRALAQITGMGRLRVRRYGLAILQALRG